LKPAKSLRALIRLEKSQIVGVFSDADADAENLTEKRIDAGDRSFQDLAKRFGGRTCRLSFPGGENHT
jgi:hypothetical protein